MRMKWRFQKSIEIKTKNNKRALWQKETRTPLFLKHFTIFITKCFKVGSSFLSEAATEYQQRRISSNVESNHQIERQQYKERLNIKGMSSGLSATLAKGLYIAKNGAEPTWINGLTWWEPHLWPAAPPCLKKNNHGACLNVSLLVPVSNHPNRMSMFPSIAIKRLCLFPLKMLSYQYSGHYKVHL